MEVKYKYGRRPGRRRRTRIAIVLLISFAIIGGIATLVYMDITKNTKDTAVTGPGRTVAQSIDSNQDVLRIDEPTFTMELPGTWKQVGRTVTVTENSITWQGAKKGEDNRKLTLYVDVIPATLAVNKLLPVSASDNSLTVGDVSDNCATFTQKGTLDAGKAVANRDSVAKYKQIDFICDLAQVVQNKTGTGSIDGINVVNVTGPAKGKHKYFFLFNDQNIQPNLSILTNALKSFKAK